MNVVAALVIAGGFLLDVIFVVILVRTLGKRKEQSSLQRKPAKENKKLGRTFILIFIGLWSAGTLSFDGYVVRGTIRQAQSIHYPSVKGKVVYCKVEEHHGDGSTYDVDILYNYEVQNQKYTCSRVRFLKLWDEEWVVSFVESHPAGSTVTVYYNPDNPGDAVLLTGIADQELEAPLRLFPFNCAMIWLWIPLLFYLFFGKPVYFRIYDRGDEIRFCLDFRLILPGLRILIFSLLPLVIFLLWDGMLPSVEAVVVIWALCLGGSALLFLAFATRSASGKRDVVIDRVRNVLTLPRASSKTEPIAVPLDAVLAVDVVREHKKDTDSPSSVYVPMLRWRSTNGDLQDARLVEWDDEKETQRLAECLRAVVGIPNSPDSTAYGIAFDEGAGIQQK